MSTRRMLLVVCVLIIGISAHAGIIYSNLQPNGSYDGSTVWQVGGNYSAQGDQFVAAASGVASLLRVPFYAIGQPENVFFVLYDDNAGNPGNGLGTFWLWGGLPPFTGFDNTTLQLVNVGGISLTGGSTYYLLAYDSNYFSSTYDLLASPTANPSTADGWARSFQQGNHFTYYSDAGGSIGTAPMGAFELSGAGTTP